MKVNRILECAPITSAKRLVASALGSVPAGYPSPAQDYSDTKIDLTEKLIRDQVSTFIVRVSGHSMEGAGISDGDELIVDRGVEPHDGNVVLVYCVLNSLNKLKLVPWHAPDAPKQS